MEIEVFPTTQALKVTDGPGWVCLTQWDAVEGKDAEIYIPVTHIEDTCRALRTAAKAAVEDLED